MNIKPISVLGAVIYWAMGFAFAFGKVVDKDRLKSLDRLSALAYNFIRYREVASKMSGQGLMLFITEC